MQRFLREVEGLLAPGAVVRDALRRATLGRDASFYRLVPEAVVNVRSVADVSRVLEKAYAHGVAVTFRAAGTSLSGQAVTDSVLLKMQLGEGRWVGMRVHGPDAALVSLEPGVIGGNANRHLQAYGRKLGPDPASIDSAMVGGIVANNASGMCCGVDGNSYHTMTDMHIVFANGMQLDTSCEESLGTFRASAFGSRLLSGLSDLREEIQANPQLAERIARKFSIKCTTGYSMNAFTDYSCPMDILKHLLIGSEGTLAFIGNVTLRTLPEHRHKASALLLFPGMRQACEVASSLKATGVVAAAELMDGAALSATRARQGEQKGGRLKSDLPEILAAATEKSTALLVEARGSDGLELDERLESVSSALAKAETALPVSFSKDPVVCDEYWAVRKGLLPIAGSMRPKGSTLLLEDVAAPTDQLPGLATDVQKIFADLGYKDTVLFGHALDGNLHLLFSEQFGSSAETDRYARLMDGLCNLVVGTYDGSCKAEHGTGRNVAPFVELEWGPEVWQWMWRVKDLFDPSAVLNPGVLLNRSSTVHLENIKVTPSVNDVVDSCIECGFCESVCPSRNTSFTPRQRIAAYRELKDANLPIEGKAAEASFSYQAEQTCAADGMCAAKCPVGIDTGKLMRQVREEKQSTLAKAIGSAVADRFALAMKGARCGLWLVDGVHRLLGTSAMNHVANAFTSLGNLFGVKLPQWNDEWPTSCSIPQSPHSSVVAAGGEGEKGEEVLYMLSCSTRCMGAARKHVQQTSSSEAAVSLLGKAGVGVRFPADSDSLCCGLAWDSRGQSATGGLMADKFAAAALKAAPMSSTKILVDNAPCLHKMRRHMAESGDAEVREVATRLVGTQELAVSLRERITWAPQHAHVTAHVPCSSKIAYGEAQQMTQLQELLAGTAMLDDGKVVSSGIACCGMAGDRGMRYPEVVRSAVDGKGVRLEEEAQEAQAVRISTSRTCEMGVAAVPLAVVLDDCAVGPKVQAAQSTGLR